MKEGALADLILVDGNPLPNLDLVADADKSPLGGTRTIEEILRKEQARVKRFVQITGLPEDLNLETVKGELEMGMRKLMCFVFAAALLSVSDTSAAQDRVSDKDLEKLMSNLKEDSKRFSDSFKKDLSKSTIRKTSEEKAARQLAERFPKQVDGMLQQFKSKRQIVASLPVVHLSYRRLGEFLNKVSPSTKTQGSWSKVKEELEKISQAFNFTPPE